jgi:hypothetical protein
MMTAKQPAKEKRSGHQTQWAAQFVVACELCKRGYEVSFVPPQLEMERAFCR